MGNNFVNEVYEQTLLGTMIVDNSIIDVVQGKIAKEQFSLYKHQSIFDQIITQYTENKAVDIISLSQKLPSISAGYITELTNLASPSNYEFYIEEVKKLYLARTIKSDLTNKLNNLTSDTILDTVHDLNSNLVDYMTMDKVKPTEIKDMCVPFIEELQLPKKYDSNFLGYDTGWDNLSTILDGIRRKKLIIIGARPSIGKSAFGLQMLRNISTQARTCMFSFEMPQEELMMRAVSLECNVPIYNLEHKLFSAAQIQKINDGVNRLWNTPMSIYDHPVENEKKLYSMIRVEALTKGTKVFLVDHLGLLRHSDNSLKRYEAVHDITIHLHELAKELDVTIICLCQLKRDAEGKKPVLSDLRESGDIEQDADVIMFIHRDRAMDNEMEVPTEILVEKNRGGSCGSAKMTFLPRLTKFIEVKENKDERL